MGNQSFGTLAKSNTKNREKNLLTAAVAASSKYINIMCSLNVFFIIIFFLSLNPNKRTRKTQIIKHAHTTNRIRIRKKNLYIR